MLEIAKNCKSLECMVYVSTATANWHRAVTKEEVHAPPFLLDEYFSAIESKNSNVINSFLKKVKPYFPNQYTLSKVVAENLCLKESGSIPICIVRPPIISPSVVSPVCGWTYKLQAFNSLVLIWTIGLSKLVLWDTDIRIQALPVDFASNSIITGAWYTVKYSADKLIVFNTVVEKSIQTTWNDLCDYGYETARKAPSMKSLRAPSKRLVCPKQRLSFVMSLIFQHLLFGLFADFLMICCFKKPE